jgi:uncharacterized protein YjdB
MNPADILTLIEETAPVGWVITNPGTGTVGADGILRLNVAATGTEQYTISVPASASGINNFSGVFATLANPVSSPITGSTSVTVAPAPVVDITPPTINLLGTSPIDVTQNTTYTDAGATASDNVDGNITANITTVNPVNTAILGTYTVTYNVSDAAGNPATQVTRTVNVVAVVVPPVTATVTRSFSTLTPAAGTSLTVSLAVAMNPADILTLIEETAPVGWVITNPGTGTVGADGILRLNVAATGTEQYTISVPASASGINNFSGVFATLANPVSSPITGSTSVTVAPAPVVPVLTTINVTSVTPSVVVGNTQQMTATTLDQNGAPIAATVTWSSSNTAVGTIDVTTGMFTAVSAGTTTVMAMNGAVMGTTLVTVTATPVTFTINVTSGANGTITPTGTAGVVTLNSGANQTFTITPNAGFNIQDVLVDGSSVGAVATFTFTNVTANHTISASFASIPVGSFTITSSAGINGNIAPLGALSFAGGTNATYTISPSAGFQVLDVLVDGFSVGAVTTFTFTNITANHTIAASFIATPVLTTITVTPSAPSIQAGTTQQFTAVAKDQNGIALVTQPVFTWTSGNNIVTTIDASGLAQGIVAGGPVLITATSGAVSGTATLTVTAVPVLTSVTVAPPTPSIIVGATQQLTANPLDQNGIAFNGAAIAWSSSDSTIATVDNNGLVTGVAVGTTTITATATSGAITVTGTATITITANPVTPVLTTINVTPVTPSVVVGNTQQMTATTLDQNGAPIAATVTWSSSNTAVGTIDVTTGMFTAVAVGTTTITATSGAVTGTTLVTVTPAPVLTTINVTPVTPSVVVGNTQQMTATTLDQNGAPIAATVTWSSSNTAVGTIDVTTGMFTAVAVGTTTITATSGAVTGTTLVTVTAVPQSSGGGGSFIRPIIVGQVLGAFTGPIAGCGNRTTGFSVTSGQSCVGNTGSEGQILGCGNRTTGFSITTGQSCIGNTGADEQVLGAEKFIFTLFLKQGSKGDEVMELQKFLNTTKYGPLVIDGKFGKKTKEAVLKFQIANGLKGDGIVGPLTRAVLNQ